MLYILALLILFILLFVVYATGGKRYLITELKNPIGQLLKRGYDEGFVIIKPNLSRKFVQFRKYIRSKGDYGIVFSFPKARWSDRFYDAVRGLGAKSGFDYYIEETVNDQDLEFIHIDFGREVGDAHSFLVKVMKEVFGLPDGQKYTVLLQNACIEDRLIDRKEIRRGPVLKS